MQFRTLMMTNTTVLLLFLVGLDSALGSVVNRQYQIIQSHMTWADAQTHCRSSGFVDLATVYSQTDVNNMDLMHFYAWTGLYRTIPNSTWLYLSEHSSSNFKTWAPGEPREHDLCSVAHYPNKLAYGTSCDSPHFAYCDHYVRDDDDDEYHNRLAFLSWTMTWSEATKYCTSRYRTTVATMHSTSTRKENFPVWIGLYREGETWSWSTGETDYKHWDRNQPGTGDCVTISSNTKKMSTQDCSSLYPFTCFRDNLILVKENKTWEEALEHCRSIWTHPHNSDIHYRLVSVQPGEDHA
uniref:C-type lectin domain-containing protein n=1 Tax=Sphaeramia orbicularis TaxID=375764 RepID=A0A672YFE8_9TELE